MKIKIHSLLLMLLLSSVAFAQNLDSQLKTIDNYAEQVMAAWDQPGMAIAVVKDDKVVFAKGYGVLNKDQPQQKVDPDTVFVIASNSKAFLAASLAILVDRGQINWEDKVTKYLPDLKLYDPWVTGELTIRDLLVHRNGLDTFSGDLLWYETTYSADQILERIKHLKPVRSFRSGYGYQNVMFVAGGQVVEKVSGKPWTEFVKAEILDPLGMDRTSTSIKDLPGNAAFPHNESGGKLRVLHRGNVDGATAAAGMNSSVNDIAKWIRLQLGRGTVDGKKILGSSRIWEMWQPYTFLPINESAARNNPTRQFSAAAMGWFTYNYHGKRIINHSGGLDGMLSYTVLMPDEDLGFVVLTNSEFPVFSIMTNKMTDVFAGAPDRDVNQLAKNNYENAKKNVAEANQKTIDARKQNTKPSLQIKEYAGYFVDDYYGSISIDNENGKLVFKMNASPNLVADLEHWHNDTFKLNWRSSTAYNFNRLGFIIFNMNRNAEVESITIDQPNNDFWFYEMSPKRVK